MKKKVFRKSILVYPFVIFLVLVLGGLVLMIVEENNVDASQQSDNINEIIAEYGPDGLPQISEELSSDLPSYLVLAGTFFAVFLASLSIFSYKWTITENGIEMKHGIFPWFKHYGFCRYSDIYNVYFYKPNLSFFGWLFRYGTIAFSTTAGTTQEYSEKMMCFPNRFVSEATTALMNFRSGNASKAKPTNTSTSTKKTTATKNKTSTTAKKAKTATTSKKKSNKDSDILNQLEKLAQLQKSGAIDEDEFKKLKKKLIK
ncbi:MAG: hypothetical protein BKP49_06805 [Treponema sp. CETP13]|nr:MAG: hypothetical protein BKP49_06805 [Treponema sp. CETP13]